MSVGGPRYDLGPSVSTCQSCGGTSVLARFAEQSGGLCGNCLADNAQPLTRIGGSRLTHGWQDEAAAMVDGLLTGPPQD